MIVSSAASLAAMEGAAEMIDAMSGARGATTDGSAEMIGTVGRVTAETAIGAMAADAVTTSVIVEASAIDGMTMTVVMIVIVVMLAEEEMIAIDASGMRAFVATGMVDVVSPEPGPIFVHWPADSNGGSVVKFYT